MRYTTATVALALAAGAVAAPQGVVYVTSVVEQTTTWVSIERTSLCRDWKLIRCVSVLLEPLSPTQAVPLF